MGNIKCITKQLSNSCLKFFFCVCFLIYKSWNAGSCFFFVPQPTFQFKFWHFQLCSTNLLQFDWSPIIIATMYLIFDLGKPWDSIISFMNEMNPYYNFHRICCLLCIGWQSKPIAFLEAGDNPPIESESYATLCHHAENECLVFRFLWLSPTLHKACITDHTLISHLHSHSTLQSWMQINQCNWITIRIYFGQEILSEWCQLCRLLQPPEIKFLWTKNGRHSSEQSVYIQLSAIFRFKPFWNVRKLFSLFFRFCLLCIYN